MLTVLSITSKNIKLLKSYQIAYLVIAIILWILICLFYVAKIAILFYTIFIKKLKYYSIKMKKMLTSIWVITNCGAYILMLIGLIYDIIVLLTKGVIGSAVYMIIYFGICFLYVIFSIIDFSNIENIISIICKHPKIIKRNRNSSSSLINLKNENSKNEKEKNN